MKQAKLSCWIAVLGKNNKVLTERVPVTLTYDGLSFTNKSLVTMKTTGEKKKAKNWGLYWSEGTVFPSQLGRLDKPVMLNAVVSLCPLIGMDRDSVEFAPGALRLAIKDLN